MPARPKQSKARATWQPTNPIAARLELLTGRGQTKVYLPDSMERLSVFPDEETREAWYWAERDWFMRSWREKGRRPWCVAAYEPELEEPAP